MARDLVIGAVARFDHADTSSWPSPLGHRAPLVYFPITEGPYLSGLTWPMKSSPVRPCIELLHVDLFEVELRVVDPV